MRTSETLTAIAPALVAASAELTGVVKDARNDHFKASYATLESVIDTARPILLKHGLCAIQGPGETNADGMIVTTRLLHESGEWIESDLQIPLAKRDPQSAGSAITYARRYGLMAMLSMPAVDDDGEAATRPAPEPIRTTTTTEGKDWYGVKNGHMSISAYAAKNKGLDAVHDEFCTKIAAAPTSEAWRAVCAEYHDRITVMPLAWRIEARADADFRAEELGFDPTERKAA